jgi:hypothetical protein
MARPRRELTGQRFGRLTVLELLPEKNVRGNLLWHCRCDCGVTVPVIPSNLRDNGRGTRSCGCLLRAIVKASNPERKATAARLKAQTLQGPIPHRGPPP